MTPAWPSSGRGIGPGANDRKGVEVPGLLASTSENGHLIIY